MLRYRDYDILGKSPSQLSKCKVVKVFLLLPPPPPPQSISVTCEKVSKRVNRLTNIHPQSQSILPALSQSRYVPSPESVSCSVIMIQS